jgi:RNA polymerase sigma-70 factor (ECF subfamily)
LKHDPDRKKPQLTLVKGGSGEVTTDIEPNPVSPVVSRDVDWSILMARAQAGDGNSYRRLLEDATPYIRAVVMRSMENRSDAEDAVQDVLFTVHTIRATYDPLRPFGPWLLAITNRRVVDHLRKQGRRRLRETILDSEHERATDIPDADVDFQDLRSLEMAIEQLSPQQKQAIHLLKLKEMTLTEVSSATGISISSLKVNTHRAMKSLRKILTARAKP